VPRKRVAYVTCELKSRRSEENCTRRLRIEVVLAPPSLPSSAVKTTSSDKESALEAATLSVTPTVTVSALEGDKVGRSDGFGNGTGDGGNGWS